MRSGKFLYFSYGSKSSSIDANKSPLFTLELFAAFVLSLSMSPIHAMATVLDGAILSNAPDWDKASKDFLPPSLISAFFEKSHKSLKLTDCLILQTCLIKESATPFIAPSPYSISKSSLTRNLLLLDKIFGFNTFIFILLHS